ncbi:tricarballylate dehydrogenase [Pullulanibacillus pueri]|uniref:Tricarballylate dehydrogenase n=1 Tax=Pullulanibacillus pueri TaxID=1437324 RepID=A0A8J3A2G1_9BACL|nr:FAD-dependent tricarballylate dehydrogenase TcuA [Pullulanibacillus pueri]MBM7684092.1 tricarballylate dehydrogenase [Pullulanibacillus pueri]GGH88633.1 tricarballylate dehydrogenase [Pullulanibacillus pueri]
MVDKFEKHYDVVVVGAGNAALCAAIAASEAGAKVLALEKAPKHKRGGNSFFTDGAIRFAFHGLDDLRKVIPSISDEEAKKINMPPYTEEKYYSDLMEATRHKSDPDLAKHLVYESYNTIKWMHEQTIDFDLIYDNQSFLKDGIHHFWGGLPVKTSGRGVGLIEQLNKRAKALGIDIWYESPAIRMTTHDDRISSIVVKKGDEEVTVQTKSVVLACGSFEANKKLRAEKLGEIWNNAIVRGTEFNTGDGLSMAFSVGAQPFGEWDCGHSIGTDANAPKVGDFTKPGDIYKKHSYPLGIMINKEGFRFVDEGADFRNYTYAKYGREILKQPGHVAYQIFDSQVRDMLRDEYNREEATCYQAETIEDLVEQLDVDREQFIKTIEDYNNAVQEGAYHPSEKDGKCTKGITPPKSNWSLKIEEGPFYAFPVTCGITFCFGGVRANNKGEVLNKKGEPIKGLFAAGEMIGGIFYENYPGGSGLMSGAVFGKTAGVSAAQYVKHNETLTQN